jgi:hypothetical protein
MEERALASTFVAQGGVVHTGESPLTLTGVVGSEGPTQLVRRRTPGSATLRGVVRHDVDGALRTGT